MHLAPRKRRAGAGAGAGALAATAGLLLPALALAPVTPAASTGAGALMGGIIPEPVSVSPDPATTFVLGPDSRINVSPGHGPAASVAGYLATVLRRSTGFRLPIVSFAASGAPLAGGITLELGGAPSKVGSQGYVLRSGRAGVVVQANAGEGLFDGVQTLRQVLPPAAEAPTRQRGSWTVPGGTVVDYPRYSYRGALLDVARHFFPVATVEAYIDQISLYKVNYLTLHLTDDQGWRLQIPGYPRLTSIGGSTAVGGGTGGYYTDAQYRQIVAFAASRYVTVVPEVDMPGHTGAAISSYGDLSCNDVAPPVYTGTNVGFSSVCVGKPAVDAWARAVVRTVASLTPGRYISLGGDEAQSTPPAKYRAYVDMVQGLIAAAGKSAMGWEPGLAQADLTPKTVPVYWQTKNQDPQLAQAAQHGTKVVMAPAEHTYLDQKYTYETKLGLLWAGPTDLQQAYSWSPTTTVAGVPAGRVLGVEAPLWSETLTTLADIDYMAFPRLPAIAEIGWSPPSTRSWASFRQRTAAQSLLWRAMGVNYYASTEVSWPA